MHTKGRKQENRRGALSVFVCACACVCVCVCNARAVRKVSGHFEYFENQPRGLDVTWQPVRGDLTVHL
jgi:hypothetical protein